MAMIRAVEGVPREGWYVLVRYSLGLLLVVAAGLKAYELVAFPVSRGGFLQAPLFLVAVIQFEFLLGFWLFAGVFLRTSWIVAVFCFASFTVVTLVRALEGATSCGCFGRVVVNPWITLSVDSVAVASLLIFRPRESEDRGTWRCGTDTIRPHSLGARFVVWGGGLVMLACLGIMLLGRNGFGFPGTGPERLAAWQTMALLTPAEWQGKRFPLLEQLDAGPQLANGGWFVVLHRTGCPSCQELLRRFEQPLDVHVSTYRLALLEVPPLGDGESRAISWPQGCLSAKLDRTWDWPAPTPMAFLVQDGVVKAAFTDQDLVRMFGLEGN